MRTGGGVMTGPEVVLDVGGAEAVPPGPVYGGAEVGSEGEGWQVATCRPATRLFRPSGPIRSMKFSGTLPVYALKL